jgi:hypothetical protein
MALTLRQFGSSEWILLVVYVVLLVGALAVAYLILRSPTAIVLTIWVMSAAALGLLSGFSTGASQNVSPRLQVVTLLSTGIIVPILGGIVALLEQPETTTETNTYSGEYLIKKVTEITVPNQATELHPIWVAGSFFAAYCIAAMIGSAVGGGGRNDGGQSGAKSGDVI